MGRPPRLRLRETHLDKARLRTRCWTALQEAGDARFPGARGRIPNFRGAERAADRLAAWQVFAEARVLKCNPDSPQRPVRAAALRAGKTVYMAVPKLADEKPFIELDPDVLGPAMLWKASSIVGAEALGRRVHADEVRPIDLIITGCVGVSRAGARLGKGGGYSDLEYAILRELGLVSADTPIATTVHACQVLPAGTIPMTAHDISLDAWATPDELHCCERAFERPPGVLDEHLPEDKRAAIPVLSRRA